MAGINWLDQSHFGWDKLAGSESKLWVGTVWTFDCVYHLGQSGNTSGSTCICVYVCVCVCVCVCEDKTAAFMPWNFKHL